MCLLRGNMLLLFLFSSLLASYSYTTTPHRTQTYKTAHFVLSGRRCRSLLSELHADSHILLHVCVLFCRLPANLLATCC